MTPSVLVAEQISEAGVDLLRASCEVTVTPGWNADELAGRIGEFDALIVRSATKVTAELLGQAGRLKVVGRAGVGVDNVDLQAASARGVVVANAPTSTVTSAAEHAIALLFCVARNVPQAHASMKSGAWDRSSFKGIELEGKTIAVLGMGRIGRIVADRAAGLGMRVVGYDPYVSPERFADLGAEAAETVDAALAQADIVTLHLPLTDETRNLIDSRALALMPRGARLVNAARGGLVDLDALQQALESGQLAGAALDVYPVEPPPPHPVFDLPNVVLTPHIAASTAEAQSRAGVVVAEQVLAALEGRPVTTAVNLPAISAEDVEALQPFVPLTTRLARLAVQLAGTGLTRISVETRGELADFDERMLGLAALIGALSGRSDQPVTPVNAEQVAEDHGIELHVSSDRRTDDFRNLVLVSASGIRDVTVGGTTMGPQHRPWLVRALGQTLEIELTENMALLGYPDVPGMIGRVGTAFGEVGVNIANMNVSREEGDALMAVSFDGKPPDETVRSLLASDAFDWAHVVHLPG